MLVKKRVDQQFSRWYLTFSFLLGLYFKTDLTMGYTDYYLKKEIQMWNRFKTSSLITLVSGCMLHVIIHSEVSIFTSVSITFQI